ncbi:hypothetical protein C8R44DRAFT_541816, partial [Mycena epipterygia]
LKAFGTGNYTRVDNVFCTADLLPLFTCCDTEPEQRPVRTDHMPIIQVLDVDAVVVFHVPQPLYRKADWKLIRGEMQTALQALPCPERYTTVESVMTAIQGLEELVRRIILENVDMSSPLPYWKRWYNGDLDDMRGDSAHLERESYHWQHAPDHPSHEEARLTCKAF